MNIYCPGTNELENLHGIRFSPRRRTEFHFSPNHNAGHNYVHVHTLPVEEAKHSGTTGFASGKYNHNCFIKSFTSGCLLGIRISYNTYI